MEVRSCLIMLVNNTSLRNCRQYTIKIFICGGFEFLSKMYGLSGASGRWALLFSMQNSVGNIINMQ